MGYTLACSVTVRRAQGPLFSPGLLAYRRRIRILAGLMTARNAAPHLGDVMPRSKYINPARAHGVARQLSSPEPFESICEA